LAESDEETGYVGKEIYGAGETLWLYLMFEALARTEDREVMVLNLDCLDPNAIGRYPPENRTFVLYNPTTGERKTSLVIPYLGEGKYRLSISKGGKTLSAKMQTSGQLLSGVRVALDTKEIQYLRVKRE